MSRAAACPGPGADILGEAADWLVRLQGGPLSAREQRALLAWRGRSPRHEEAWRRAEDVLRVFQQVPPELGREVIPKLARRAQASRRRVLAALVGGAGAIPLCWLAMHGTRELTVWADQRSAVGEIRDIALPDGTRVVLNTGTAIDVLFTGLERRVRLRSGEILIETAPDPAAVKRPFLVETVQGTARALGTRYTVRQFDDATGVAVYDGRVALRRASEPLPFTVLAPGESLRFGNTWAGPVRAADPAAVAWEHGMLVARDMRLAALIDELARYRPGVLRISGPAADLRVSGAFPLRDTDTCLALLAETMPVRVTRITRYWVTVHG